MNLSDDRGTTFVEILVAMVIMATVVLAVIAGMSATTASSGTHRRQAEAHNILIAAVERVRSNEEVAYNVTCDKAAAIAAYQAVARTVPIPSVGFTTSGITIEAIKYYQYPVDPADPNAFLASPCKDGEVDSNGNHIYRMQLITLKVETTNGAVSETLSFIKAGE